MDPGTFIQSGARPCLPWPETRSGGVSVDAVGGDEVVSKEWAHRFHEIPGMYFITILLAPATHLELSTLLSRWQQPHGLVGVCDGEVLGVEYPPVPFMGGLSFNFASVEQARRWAAALADNVLEAPALWTITDNGLGSLVVGRSVFEVLQSLVGLCATRLGTRSVEGRLLLIFSMRCGITTTMGTELISRRVDLQATAVLAEPAVIRTIYLTGGKAKTPKGNGIGNDATRFIDEFGEPTADFSPQFVCLEWPDHSGLRACLDHEDEVHTDGNEPVILPHHHTARLACSSWVRGGPRISRSMAAPCCCLPRSCRRPPNPRRAGAAKGVVVGA